MKLSSSPILALRLLSSLLRTNSCPFILLLLSDSLCLFLDLKHHYQLLDSRLIGNHYILKIGITFQVRHFYLNYDSLLHQLVFYIFFRLFLLDLLHKDLLLLLLLDLVV